SINATNASHAQPRRSCPPSTQLRRSSASPTPRCVPKSPPLGLFTPNSRPPHAHDGRLSKPATPRSSDSNVSTTEMISRSPDPTRTRPQSTEDNADHLGRAEFPGIRRARTVVALDMPALANAPEGALDREL